MNALVKIFFLPASIFILTSCGDSLEDSKLPYREGAEILKVEGMHCSNCEGSIMSELAKLKDLEWARAESKVGEVAYTGNVSRDDVAVAISKAGFKVAR